MNRKSENRNVTPLLPSCAQEPTRDRMTTLAPYHPEEASELVALRAENAELKETIESVQDTE